MANEQIPEDLVREYEGEDLYSIGTHVPEKSFYNHNYYRLPNGTLVLLKNDDFDWNDVFVVDEEGREHLVGGQQDEHPNFMIGRFT